MKFGLHNINHAIPSSCNHQTDVQTEACIKFVKGTMKKCFESDTDVNLAVLQVRSIPMWLGLPKPATILFNMVI